jgi:hypothetical protein
MKVVGLKARGFKIGIGLMVALFILPLIGATWLCADETPKTPIAKELDDFFIFYSDSAFNTGDDQSLLVESSTVDVKRAELPESATIYWVKDSTVAHQFKFFVMHGRFLIPLSSTKDNSAPVTVWIKLSQEAAKKTKSMDVGAWFKGAKNQKWFHVSPKDKKGGEGFKFGDIRYEDFNNTKYVVVQLSAWPDGDPYEAGD